MSHETKVYNGLSSSENIQGDERFLGVDVKHTDVDQVNRHLLYFSGTTKTLATAASIGDFTLTLNNVTGIVAGTTRVFISSGDTEETDRLKVTAVSAPDITVHQPLDNAYPIGATIEVVDTNLISTTATQASPRIYRIQPPSNEIWHLLRLNFVLNGTNTAMDNSLFGSIAALTNGLILQKTVNSVVESLTNWGENGDFTEDMFDTLYTDKGPGGINGFQGRWTFRNMGIVHELNGSNSDCMDMVVQDDATGNNGLEIKIQGHVEKILT